MIVIWAFTDHVIGYRNENLLQLSPVAILALIALVARRWRWMQGCAVTIVAVALAAALLRAAGLLAQDNLAFIGLALPLNLASLWAVRRLTPPPPVAEVAPKPS
jgi:hypothetical protein